MENNHERSIEEVLHLYDVAKYYDESMDPEKFGSFYRLDQNGVYSLEDLFKTDAIQEKRYEAQESAAQAGINKLMQRIQNPKNYICAPTGFDCLDGDEKDNGLLDGGLYAGLYVIGAISSLGKTSFVVHMADNIAKSGRKVIYISLEMAEEEIIAKSISRLTLEETFNISNGDAFKKDTRHILNGKLWEEYTTDEKTVINNAISKYKEYANNLFIYEGVGTFSVDDVREIVKEMTKPDELPPVVIIDYIQILAPADRSMIDAKRNMDYQIVELKRISRDFNVPVVGISSFNRASYAEGVSFSALKESGAIEYTADVVIGLQYKGVDEIINDDKTKSDREQRIKIKKIIEENEDKAYRGESQTIQVKLLKNRNGAKGSRYLQYAPKYNYFYEIKK